MKHEEKLERVNDQEYEVGYRQNGMFYLKMERFDENKFGIYARCRANELQIGDYLDESDLNPESGTLENPEGHPEINLDEFFGNGFVIRWLNPEEESDHNWISYEGEYREGLKEIFRKACHGTEDVEADKAIQSIFSEDRDLESMLKELSVDSSSNPISY